MAFHTPIYYFGNALLAGLVCAGVGGTVASALRMQQWSHEQPSGPKSGAQKQKLKKTGNGGTFSKLKVDNAADDGPRPPPLPFTTSFDGGLRDGSEPTVISRMTVEIEDNALVHPFLIELPESIRESVMCVEATSGSSDFSRIGTPWPSKPASSVPRGDAATSNTSATVLTLLFTNLTDHLYDLFAGHHEQQDVQDAYAHLGPDKRPPTTFRPIRGNKVPLCGVEGLVLLLNRTEMNVKGPRSVLTVGTVVPFFYALSPDSGAGSVELEHFAIDPIHAAEEEDYSDFELDPAANETSGLSAKEVAAMLKLAELWGREGSGPLNMSSRAFSASAECAMNWMGPYGTWDMTAPTEVRVAVGGGCKLRTSGGYFCMTKPIMYSCIKKSSSLSIDALGTAPSKSVTVYKISVPSLGGDSVWDAYGYPYLEVYTTGGLKLTTYAPWAPLTNQGILTKSPSGFGVRSKSSPLDWTLFVPSSVYSKKCGLASSPKIKLFHASLIATTFDAVVVEKNLRSSCTSTEGGYQCTFSLDISSVNAIFTNSVPNPYFYLMAEAFVCSPGLIYDSFVDLYSPQFFLNMEKNVNVVGAKKILIDTQFPTDGGCAAVVDQSYSSFQSLACRLSARYPSFAFSFSAFLSAEPRTTDNTATAPVTASLGVARIYWDTSKNFFLSALIQTNGGVRIETKMDFNGSTLIPIAYLYAPVSAEVSYEFPILGEITFAVDYKLGAELEIYGRASVEAVIFIPLKFTAYVSYRPGEDITHAVAHDFALEIPTISGFAELNIKPVVTLKLQLGIVGYVLARANLGIYVLLTAHLAYPALPALPEGWLTDSSCQVPHNLELVAQLGYFYDLAAQFSFLGLDSSMTGDKPLLTSAVCSPKNDRMDEDINPYGLPTAGGATPLRVVAKYASSSPTPDERAETVLGLRLLLVSLLQKSLGGGTTLMPSAIQMIPIQNTLKTAKQQSSDRSFEAADEGSTEDYYVYSFTTTVDSRSDWFPLMLKGDDGRAASLDLPKKEPSPAPTSKDNNDGSGEPPGPTPGPTPGSDSEPSGNAAVDSSSDGIPIAVIAGAVGGGIVLIVIGVIIACLCTKCRKVPRGDRKLQTLGTGYEDLVELRSQGLLRADALQPPVPNCEL